MDYNQIRNLLAVMHRGDIITVPHVTEDLKVTFDNNGKFGLAVTRKGESRAHGTSGGYTSLKQFAGMLEYYFEPKDGYVYQHINGNVYTVIAIANKDSKRKEYPPTVVYQGHNGLVWTKPVTNFISKMTRIK